MSKLSETLSDLISDSGLNLKETAEKIGLHASGLTYYTKGEREPSVETIIKIAEYYNCSVDFLLGREAENKNLTFKPCPPFAEQLKFLKSYFNCSSYRFYNNTKISKTAYYALRRGAQKPTLETIINLADAFDCRVDFILGRES